MPSPPKECIGTDRTVKADASIILGHEGSVIVLNR